MGKINPYFLFCQGLLNSPVVGQSRGCADHKKRPDYLAEAQVRRDEAECAWLAQTDVDPPAYEAMRRLFDEFQRAEADYRAAWQRWNEEKAALIAALN
jgi:hypothetical protein